MLALLLLLLMAACCRAQTAAGPPPPSNILFVVVDNMRPAIGAYGNTEVVTPHMDALAANATLFSRAFCQEAWCSPSRNSFLTGRVPDVTQVWNFKASFRRTATGEPGAGASWTTLPGYFKDHGYYSSAAGKVFHPRFPANFDYPASWTEQPVNWDKYECILRNCSADTHQPCGLMGCAFAPGVDRGVDADTLCADLTLTRLHTWAATPPNHTTKKRPPFFLAAGFQSPRLPWSYPGSVVSSRYPKGADALSIAKLQDAPAASAAEDLEVRQRSFPLLFMNILKRDHFTKTGSGQT